MKERMKEETKKCIKEQRDKGPNRKGEVRITGKKEPE